MFDSLSSRLDGIAKRLRGKGRLTEADVDDVMREIRTALLEADVNVHVVDDPVRLGAMGGLRLAMEVPEDMWKNLTLATR